MKIFQHKSWPLKIIILVSASILFFAGNYEVFQWLQRPIDYLSAIFSFALLFWSIALIRMTAWASTLVAALLFGFAIFAPIGLIMPDRDVWIGSASEGLSLVDGLVVVPIVVVNFFAVHILGKYKADFITRWI
jgi:hypothetical protein